MSRSALMLAALADGKPKSRREIFEQSGEFFLTNNAASELREQGIEVECRREGELYLYRLVSSLGAAVPPHPSPGNADNGSGRQRLEPTAAPSDATGQLVMV